MGTSISKNHEYILPYCNDLNVLYQEYCEELKSGLILSKRIGTIGDFKVKNEMNEKILNITRSGNEIIISNTENIPLLIIKKKKMNILGKSYHVYLPQNISTSILTVKSHFKIAFTSISVKVNDNTGKKCKVVLKGDLLNRMGHIYKGNPKKGGAPISIMNKSFSLRSLLSKEYVIHISGGIDQLLMIILTLIFDELHTKHKKQTNFSFEI
jgi:hypothetical protein